MKTVTANNDRQYSRTLAMNDLRSEDTATVCRALLGMAFCEPDWRWTQDIFLDFLENRDSLDVKRMALTCLGHIARIHQQIEKDKIMPVLEKYRNHPDLNGTVSDVFDDFELFLT